MCLYGHDLDESVSPVEAGLSWVIGTSLSSSSSYLSSSNVADLRRVSIEQARIDESPATSSDPLEFSKSSLPVLLVDESGSSSLELLLGRELRSTLEVERRLSVRSISPTQPSLFDAWLTLSRLSSRQNHFRNPLSHRRRKHRNGIHPERIPQEGN